MHECVTTTAVATDMQICPGLPKVLNSGIVLELNHIGLLTTIDDISLD